MYEERGTFHGFLKVLLKNNASLKVSGVDMSKEDVMLAQKLIPEGFFSVTDNKTLPFTDSSFDIVISSMTLHHMSNPIASLLGMKRVLKQSGSIYLIDMISNSGWLHKLLKYIKCPEPYHFEKWYTLSDTKDLLKKVDLQIERIDSVLVFPSISIMMPVRIIKISRP